MSILTLPIRHAQDVLLAILLVLQLCVLVLHPGHDGEVFAQRVVEAVFWDLHSVALAVKVEHLVALLAVVGGKVLGPGSGETGGGKEVHTTVIGT